MSGSEATPRVGDGLGPNRPEPSDEVRRYLLQNPGDDTGGVNDIPLLREQTRAVGLRVRGEIEPVAVSEDVVIAGVNARTYTPMELTRPNVGLVWVHGGGWMHGDLDVYEEVARAFANQLGCEAIAVDYGLAPEHPFPEGLDDVWAVVQWATTRFEDVVVAGDSSGGTIAAAAAIKARDAGIPLAAQLLIYPVLESSDATEFKQRFRTRYSPFAGQEKFGELTHQRIKWIWDVYVPDPVLRETPLATPMRVATLVGVAPAVIITAEHDILRGEGEAYAERLRADAVPVELMNFPGQIHGFIQMRGVLTEAKTALEKASMAVARVLDHQTARRTPAHPAPTKES
jgi:acetyl esterase